MANELNCVQIKRRRADISNPSRRRRPDYTNNSINVLPWWLFAKKNSQSLKNHRKCRKKWRKRIFCGYPILSPGYVVQVSKYESLALPSTLHPEQYWFQYAECARHVIIRVFILNLIWDVLKHDFSFKNMLRLKTSSNNCLLRMIKLFCGLFSWEK